MKECGSKLTELSPRGVNAIFERMRNILHEAEVTTRVQYMIEVRPRFKFTGCCHTIVCNHFAGFKIERTPSVMNSLSDLFLFVPLIIAYCICKWIYLTVGPYFPLCVDCSSFMIYQLAKS